MKELDGLNIDSNVLSAQNVYAMPDGIIIQHI